MKYALLMLLILPALGADKPAMESARVLSQEFVTAERGVYVAPLGNGVAGVPITRETNYVVVRVGDQIMEWAETGRSQIVLPVNGVIEFYREKDWFIVLDPKRKKHKFALMRLTLK